MSGIPVTVAEAGATALPVLPPARALHLRGRTIPVLLPKLRDSRLHVAAVVLTIHTLGQLGLNFRVSVPQIVAAILTCAVIGVVQAYRATGSLVWPASAMLTGSGVALILRIPGTPDSTWTFHAWWMFAGVAAFCLLTKSVVKYRGSHLFNPSNVGLVITFVVLGSLRAEPLDFWWAPLNGWMILAYLVIIGGGSIITWRIGLFASAATFYVAFAGGMAVLAASGHCITARWAFAPVCGAEFWRAVVFSPEVLIFLFFMITDPKTVPQGRVGRIVFGLLVAITCTLLMAPQTTEFGSKVALLAGLVVMCACRPLIDRLVPVPGSPEDRIRPFLAHVATGGRSGAGALGRLARVGLVGVLAVAFGLGVVAAGTSARGVIDTDSEEVLGRVPHEVNPATFPAINVEQGVLDWNHSISGAGAQQIVLTLVENLELENQALLQGDESILEAVDHGDRLEDMRARLADAEATGLTTVVHYEIDDVNVHLLVPFGRQDGLSLGMQSRGTATTETYDTAGELQSSSSAPFATTFVMRRATGDRWLNVDELPYEQPD